MFSSYLDQFGNFWLMSVWLTMGRVFLYAWIWQDGIVNIGGFSIISVIFLDSINVFYKFLLFYSC